MPSCGSHCRTITKKTSAAAARKPTAKKTAASKSKPKAKPRTVASGCCYSKTGGCGTTRSKKAPAKSRNTICNGRGCLDYSSCSDSTSCSCSDCLTDGYDSCTDSSDSYTDSSSSSDEGYRRNKCKCGK